MMANSNKAEIIDLTSLDYYSIPRNNSRIIDDDVLEVIDLVDDSFNDGTIEQPDVNTCDRKKTSKVENSTKTSLERYNDNEAKTIGFCSICLEKLGKNPLVSTICGHVYCLECLERSLELNKHCPCCRCILRGASAYHPLYLDLG